MERLIFHADVNSAFLSWEAAWRVRNGESDLRLIPSCIGGDPETRRGIVVVELWRDRRPLRLMGIALTNLTRDGPGGQMSLFGETQHESRERDAKLDKVVDALRGKFGSDIIQRGAVMATGVEVARKFKGKQDVEVK